MTGRVAGATRESRRARSDPTQPASRELQQVRELFREYQPLGGRAVLLSPASSRSWPGCPGNTRRPADRLLLALAEGAPAGCVALRNFDAGRSEMKRLYVRPAYQGQGLGRRLAQAAIHAARAAGSHTLLLDTLPKMASAIALYRALGFVPRGPYASSPTPGAVFFELRL